MKPNIVLFAAGGAFSGILRRRPRRGLQRGPSLGRRGAGLARFDRLSLVSKSAPTDQSQLVDFADYMYSDKLLVVK